MFLQHTLSNGIRIIAEKRDHFRSVTLGIWSRAGSRDELAGEEGISHFIEHMLFKGTDKRSARDISSEIDAIGGQINAFTAKECTCFYAKVMDEHYDIAFDILSDMLMHSVIDPREMEKEKGVVVEEIHMVEDTPEDLVHELLCASYFEGHALAKPILGSVESVSAFTREAVFAYLGKHYVPENIVLSVAGSFDFAHVVALAERAFADWPYHAQRATARQAHAYRNELHRCAKDKATEQLHLCLGYRGVSMTDPALYALSVCNNILGGGMSSRLFQQIREERGLAYSVYSYPSLYTDTGMMGIYAGTTVSQGGEVVRIITDTIADMMHGGIPEEEFAQAKNQLRGNFILGNESSSSRMMSIGKSYLLTGRVHSEQEMLDRIDAVTLQDVVALTRQCFDVQPAVSVVGPKQGDEAVAAAL
nr:pitrilysin family protein [Maliibacterium massiliense]